jgi:excisionase family DNA binding protein
MVDLITTSEAAKIIGVKPSRVRQYHLAGRLVGERMKGGRDLLFDRKEVERFAKLDRPPGRPKTREN